MKILVLAGGDSAEREVSLQSGHCVVEALNEAGHLVDTIDPAATAIESLAADRWDIAFPMVHGTGGEDGVLQRALDVIGLRYVGSSAAVSELTFDKIRTNERLHENGLPVADNRVVWSQQTSKERRAVVLDLGLPVVTKPPRQGSSVGISIVNSESQIDAALTAVFQFDDDCLVEAFIVGREITVPVIDGMPYPAIEIRPAEAWYDYHAKYQDDRTKYIVEPNNLNANVADLAVIACEVCGVSGIARVDFRIDDAGRPWILEVNTIPGMTSHSLVPKSAAHLGLSLADLCEAAIRKRLEQDL